MTQQTQLEPSSFAYIFPGQGSQAVGMGWELYQSSPAAREVFDEADEVLGGRLSRLCFEGPEDELRQTVNAQPALLATSVAAMRAIAEAMGGRSAPAPKFVAGHSVGEYAALVAAGAVGFPQALQLVRERGRLMHEAGQVREGGMAAILGLDLSALEQVCQETGAEIGNINCDGQIVISGGKEALVRAIDLSRALGAKRAVPLVVSAAFHSSLMQPAVHGMTQALENASFGRPFVPVIANCTGTPLQEAAELRAELVEQLCRCVQWSKSVDYMADNGVDTFVEVGPGKVLAGLVKRIAKGRSRAEHRRPGVCQGLRGLKSRSQVGVPGVGREGSAGHGQRSRHWGELSRLRLAAAGATLALNSTRDTSATEREVKEDGGSCISLIADVTRSDEVERLIEGVVAGCGSMDILVNNAGISRDSLVLRISDQDWEDVLNTSLRGSFFCTRSALRHMLRSRWGRVVNIGSVVGLRGNPGQANYSSAKAGLVGFYPDGRTGGGLSRDHCQPGHPGVH